MEQMTPHKINDMDNFIMAWQANDLGFCDEITKYHNSKEAYRGRINSGILNLEVKDSHDVNFFLEPNNLYYFLHLQKCLELYIEKYPSSNNNAAFTMKEPAVIQKYLPGGGYKKWHCERSSSVEPYVSRHLVFMTYLNDVTDCGETEFFHQKIKIQPKKGLTVIWPADWTFTHKGIPSPTQEKIIITGWFNYLEKAIAQ